MSLGEAHDRRRLSISTYSLLKLFSCIKALFFKTQDLTAAAVERALKQLLKEP